MKTKLNSNIRIFFYLLWFISLLLQANFTEINADEAYYWMYSKKLAWGYFDHPPIIALIIKLGYGIFHNELGVRLISIVLSTLTIILIEKIIKPKDVKTFFMLVASIGILHFIGFYAIPDSPFLFFSAAYLIFYKKLIDGPSVNNAILLGCIVALMCLSKYHGIIIISLTLISNLKLITKNYFWLTAIVACVFLIPHFLWQISSEFPSIKYHLFERSTAPYRVSYTLEYLAGQLFVLGPITGIVFIIAAIKVKSANQFEKTLKVLFWGGYIVFFLMSFKGRVEAHWTLFTVLPALYFGYHYFENFVNSKALLKYTLLITLLLVIPIRILIAIDIKSSDSQLLFKVSEQFGNKGNMLAIHRHAGECPVAFMNSYQAASLYSFYSKSEGFSLNNIMGRKNQFDIWDLENTYRGEKIMMIPNYDVKEFDSIQGISKTIRYTFIENFQSFSAIKITETGLKKNVSQSDTLNITVTLTKTKNNDFDLNSNPNYPSYIYYQFFKDKALIKEERGFRIENEMLNQILKLDVITPEKKGNYGLYFSIKTGWLPPTINSKRYEVRI